MIVFTRKGALGEYLDARRAEGKSVGFVPTMGALHEGHLALVRRAAAETDVPVVSIFVNPTQFDNPDDLAKYPRRLERDLHLLEGIDKDMVVYIPVAEDLYEGNVEARPHDHGGLDRVMEGRWRPGHFDGVATVVGLLFDAVQPHKAYFGEKDFQQLRIIQHMTRAQGRPVEIVPVPIVREADGLAMSSRNLRLTPEAREAAPFIYRILLKARELARAGRTPAQIKEEITRLFDRSPLRLEYFEIASEDDLQPARAFEPGKNYRAFAAAYAGDIRLIDNLRIK
ncbi:MAG: pantoate--beta-alanine ligase [Chlorobi bacterium]|nr:pantoate--beta-alanine ligase [Chlorobiota bacterium]